ncbi:MAG: bifunctional hydroxymethylpyrimidine kinase/phosphomethylpyrimidine kinase [Verrucomicrobia bacterium]|nr:bifunctional hydroxymethylpyrimidine kinase/phosphomethylpyrimidine kinase [Verrucomicrobiota bacterium]
MPVRLNTTPVALSVAGSDCSCGAGAQADLKTFSAHGVYGLTALTCVVAEVPGKVTRIDAIEPGMLAEQLKLLLNAFPVAAMKTGMVPSRAHVEAICSVLDRIPADRLPMIVVDPVMVATSGDRLIDNAAFDALQTELFTRALLLTPNMGEASALLGHKVNTVADLEPAARSLAERFQAAVLVKGGHLTEGVARDVLVTRTGEACHFDAGFVQDRDTHGTGCTLSAAIASNLAKGASLEQSIRNAKRYVHRAIEHIMRWDGVGAGKMDALNHFATPGL